MRFIPEKLGTDIEHSYSQRLKKATQTLQAEKYFLDFELLTGQVYKQRIRSIGYYIL